MEYQGHDCHCQQIGNRDPGRNDLPDHQISTAKQKRQSGDLTDGTHAVSKEHIDDSFLRKCRHDHVMQRSSRADAVHILIDRQTNRPNEHQERTAGQRGIKDVLTKSAKQALRKDDGKKTAQCDLPIRDRRGKRHGQEQTSDHCRTVNDGITGTGHHVIKPLSNHSRSDTDQGHDRSPITKSQDTDQ